MVMTSVRDASQAVGPRRNGAFRGFDAIRAGTVGVPLGWGAATVAAWLRRDAMRMMLLFRPCAGKVHRGVLWRKCHDLNLESQYGEQRPFN